MNLLALDQDGWRGAFRSDEARAVVVLVTAARRAFHARDSARSEPVEGRAQALLVRQAHHERSSRALCGYLWTSSMIAATSRPRRSRLTMYVVLTAEACASGACSTSFRSRPA